MNSSSSLRKGLVSFDQFGKTFSSEEEAVWAATSYPNIYEGGTSLFALSLDNRESRIRAKALVS